MEQFIQYLYEYSNGERVRNLGFMKVDHRMDKIELQIYAKQLDEVSGIRFKDAAGNHYIAAWEMADEGYIGAAAGYSASLECRDEDVDSDYIPPSNRSFEKIQRQDLSRLPRKEWYLANNNSLLHGYYNYHHLMLIKDEDELWLGVPGIFHEKEKAAAESFGFPEFIRMTDFEVELLPEEKNTMDDFGYWCRQVEHL